MAQMWIACIPTTARPEVIALAEALLEWRWSSRLYLLSPARYEELRRTHYALVAQFALDLGDRDGYLAAAHEAGGVTV